MKLGDCNLESSHRVVPKGEGVHGAQLLMRVAFVHLCVATIHRDRIFDEEFLLEYYLRQKGRKHFFFEENSRSWMENSHFGSYVGMNSYCQWVDAASASVWEMKQEWRNICMLKWTGKFLFSLFLPFFLLHLGMLLSLLFPVFCYDCVKKPL